MADITFLDVEDEAQAEKIASGQRGRHLEVWKDITEAFLGTGRRFLNFDPTSEPRLATGVGENGEAAYLKAGAVASGINSYVNHRNLGVKANTRADGLVQLARIEVEGAPVEPGKPGRKGRKGSQPAPEAE
jgi:hypothetical protein